MAFPTARTLHGFKLSGHSHRAELMLRLLDLPFRFAAVDLAAGAQRSPEFLALNRFGTVPVLEDGDTVVPDSVAILTYLALRYDPERRWLPADPVVAAEVQRWLSVAQNQVAHGPAAARLVGRFGVKRDLAQAQEIGKSLFAVLEAELADRHFIAAAHQTIADVALYSYIAVAPEGGLALEPYPAIGAWLDRVRALPRFEEMPR
jgi:glutathione S-transferase